MHRFGFFRRIEDLADRDPPFLFFMDIYVVQVLALCNEFESVASIPVMAKPEIDVPRV